MKEYNPYLNRGPVRNEEMFFGRTKEKENIYEYLQALENVSIVGEPKIGKSSLLINMCRKDSVRNIFGPEFCMVYVNLQDIGEVSLENFYTLIREELIKNEIEADFNSSKTFRNFITDRYEDSDEKLALCLDEFEVLTNSNLKHDFYSFLRGISVKKNFAFIIASRQYLSQICQTENALDSELWNVFQTFVLEGLSSEEAKQLIEVPFQRVNRELPIEAEKILELTKYNPFNIVSACYHVFDGVTSINDLKKLYKKELDPHDIRRQSVLSKKAVRVIWFFYGLTALFIIISILIYLLRGETG